MSDVGEATGRDLEERFGGVYDVAALARFCGPSRRALREALKRAGVPVLEIGRKRIVVRELADRALGLDRAELAIEIKRNEESMRRLEHRPDGSRKTVAEYAAETGAMGRQALTEHRR